MNPKVYLRERILTPLLLTLLAAGIIVTIIINVSRVFLAVGGDKGIYVSSGIAVAILLAAVWAATRPRLPAHSGMFLLAFAGIASMIAGSLSFNRSQPHEASAATVPYATDDAIVGQPGTALAFDKSQLEATVSTAAPGIHIDLSSGNGTHTWVVEGHEDQLKLEANPGSPAMGTIVLPPGTYTYYCDIPGHRQAGMHGTLTVTADPSAQPINAPAGGAGGETSTTAAGG
jgi:plastocyanin